MKRLLLFLVALIVTCGASTAHAAAPPHGQHVPVVAAWFSNLRPVSGQHEVLAVEFSRGTHGFAGGRISATIRYGRHVTQCRGTTPSQETSAFVLEMSESM